MLPPTLGVELPNRRVRFEESPFYVNSETRPWIKSPGESPRRAGVSAFGFGGTNFHAVLEEYTGDYLPARALTHHAGSELLLWSAASKDELATRLESLEDALAQGARPVLRDLSRAVYQAFKGRRSTTEVRLAIVAASLDELREKLAQALSLLETDGQIAKLDPRGLYLAEVSEVDQGKLALLFPGQGSQSPDMLRDLAVAFPEVREAFERADQAIAGRLPQRLSRFVFPPPAFNAETKQAHQEALTQTNVAQPAMGAAGIGMFRLLESFGLRPDAVAGHSYGEYVALCAAGAMGEADLIAISELRGRAIIEAARDDLGTMAAVKAAPATIAPLLADIEGVWLANLNSPHQTMISGTRAGVSQAIERLEQEKIAAQAIAVAAAFHSPIVAPAGQRLSDALSKITFSAPSIKVFSNSTAAPYPETPDAIVDLLGDHLVQPVRFSEEIEAMYAAGMRVFVEVGPRTVLSGLVRQTLGQRPAVVVATDQPGKHGVTHLQHTLGQLAVAGVSLRLDRLYESVQDQTATNGATTTLNLNRLVEETAPKPLSPTIWQVNGGRSRPQHEAAGPVHHPIVLRTASAEQGAAEQTSVAPQPVAMQQAVPDQNVHQHRSPDTRPVVAAPAIGSGIANDATQVMDQFQHMMGQFLETQRNVMLDFLQTPSTTTLPVAAPQSSPGITQDVYEHVPVEQPLVAQATLQPVLETQRVEQVAPAAHTNGTHTNSTPASNKKFDQEALTAQLLGIVSERTGYPVDMLNLDLDVEANLGIDSIKRVEILGQLRQTLTAAGWAEQDVPMDRLSALKTLRGVVEAIAVQDDTSLSDDAPAAVSNSSTNGHQIEPIERQVQAGAAQNAEPVPDRPTTQRLTLRLVERSLPAQAEYRLPDGVIVVTDDETGIAHEIAERLREAGQTVALVQELTDQPQIGSDVYRGRFQTAEDVAQVVDQIRRTEGPIAGLIHLFGLRAHPRFEELDRAAFLQQMEAETRSLFLLAQALAPDLQVAAETGGAMVVAASGMGGTFASES